MINMDYGLVFKNTVLDSTISIEAKGLLAYIYTYHFFDVSLPPFKEKMCEDLNITAEKLEDLAQELEKAGAIKRVTCWKGVN